MKKLLLTLSLGLVLAVATGCGATSVDGDTPANTETPAGTEAPANNEETEGSTETPAADVSYNDGTYEGTSDAGISEGLKVSVTVEDGKITEVEVVEHNETDGIGTNAINALPGKIVEAQSTDVDDVSGATLSSNAIKEAVNNALEQAQ
ncbi:MAG: FMN-binding protein [Desulfitobacterium sp.]|nr:FMN-binding protein [Desulfitobacterium sp.]